MAKEKRDIEIKSRADTMPLMGPDVRPWPVTPPPTPEEHEEHPTESEDMRTE